MCFVPDEDWNQCWKTLMWDFFFPFILPRDLVTLWTDLDRAAKVQGGRGGRGQPGAAESRTFFFPLANTF